MIGISEQLMDARSLFLTPNATPVHVPTRLNLIQAPKVLQMPPPTLGPADDAAIRWVTDRA
ncbi:hypothetical protein [Vulcanococcus limneticus]|uniref:hypothetical protein n=1 Tax=Vulcanococcus limneticus TaxID=2170428 RepID=UPI00398BCCF8